MKNFSPKVTVAANLNGDFVLQTSTDQAVVKIAFNGIGALNFSKFFLCDKFLFITGPLVSFPLGTSCCDVFSHSTFAVQRAEAHLHRELLTPIVFSLYKRCKGKQIFEKVQRL